MFETKALLSMVAATLIVAAVATVASTGLVSPRSAAAGDQPPAAVAAGLKELTDMCREVGGTPQTANAVKKADLNGDGYEDFVLDVGSVGCEGAASLYGDREKLVTVYVGDGKGGAVSAFSDSVFGAKLEGSGADAKLWVTVSGAGCGKKPAADFASEAFCDRALVWNGAAKKFELAPVSTVRMIE